MKEVSLMFPNYLVTGGTGLAGSHVLRHLVSKGLQANNIVAFDAFPNLGNVADIADCITLVRGDVTSIPQLLDCVYEHQPDYVIHLAACRARQSWENPNKAISVTLQGTANLFDVLSRTEVLGCVYASTSGVYGTADAIYWNDREEGVSEDDPVTTTNPYSATKYATEAVAYVYGRRAGLQTVGVRLGGFWGSGADPRDGPGQFCTFIRDAALGGSARIPAFWTGFGAISLSYVKDVARQLVELCPKAAGELPRRVYNQGPRTPFTIGDVCEVLRDIVPSVEFLPSRNSEDSPWIKSVVPPRIDASRWYEELGFDEEWPLRAAVRDFANLHRAGAGLAPL